MRLRIRTKLGLTILAVALVAAIPLSLYIVEQQERERIESAIAIGRGNTRLLARTMLDVFLKTGGDVASMRIDAEEAIATYKEQFELGLVYGETLMLTKKDRGLVMARLEKPAENAPANAQNANDKNDKGKEQSAQIKDQPAQPAKAKVVTRRSEAEIAQMQAFEENHEGQCFHNPAERCFNFSFTAKYDKTPVVLSFMAISEEHIRAPIRRLRMLVYISAGIAVILAIVMGIAISRFITGPINALMEGVRRYAKGDLSYKVKIRVQDELQTLGNAFNEMAEDIAAKIKEIEDHRDNLEKKVQERTQELREALVQVSKLKEQQDADYYLTTFLFKPLCINRNSSEYIRTDFYIEQKKQFNFRNKHVEIGGDICITANLLFREESGLVNRYLFATNADAMGKSIQGAGGAIVYGTAINTILATSTAGNRVLSTPPREWLLRMYRELHNIFLSFDGSMLVSGAFLLINEHNGKAYYINAEHPWAILYRDETPDFIENELMLRKLGTALPMSEVIVREYTFAPGDVLFMGSDGRDDIIIHEDEATNTRIINEDERQILDVIRRAGGDLKKTVEVLREKGRLSDDLSLIRIEIIGFNPEPIRVQTETTPVEVVKDRLLEIRELIRKRNFAAAADALRAISNEIDIETVPQYYVLLSRIQMNDGQLELAKRSLEKAIELGHKAAPVYKSLGNIFFKLNMKDEARNAWQTALRLNPDDEQLKKLLESVAPQTS
ncbi:MAG: SpoIIE family protein phosphatase [Turneriella sp.]|nr:SpoIIE family protein phosphatase [Turneriella sp.]